MGEREMILVLGAMLFFSMTTMSINRFCLNNSEVMMESEFIYYATSLAQGIIEEAKTKAFDENIISTPTRDSTNFTYPPGREGSAFDDVDDYDYYDESPLNIAAEVNGPKVDYTVKVQVGYVLESDLDTEVTYQTFHKKMTLTVTSSFMSDPVILSHVFSYFEY